MKNITINSNITSTIRQQLTDSRTKATVTNAVGWSPSDVSRVLGGTQGVPLEKIEPLLQAIGYIVIDEPFLEAMKTLSLIASEHLFRSPSTQEFLS